MVSVYDLKGHLDYDYCYGDVVVRLSPISIPEQTASLENSLDESKQLIGSNEILTPSNVNNGGGFSVPRYCADLIFPPLDFRADSLVHTLTVKDVHDVIFEFHHIYRGTLRRHLLTTGWSKFVTYKKLVADNSVVFMRSSRSGENFIGIRRDVRVNACSN